MHCICTLERHLHVAVAQLDCQALFAGVRHCLTVSFNRGRSVSPTGAVQSFFLEDRKLGPSNPVRCFANGTTREVCQPPFVGSITGGERLVLIVISTVRSTFSSLHYQASQQKETEQVAR